SDSSGTASKEGRFCFRPLSERRCRPGNLVGSCSGGSFTRPDGSETRRYASATKLFLPPAISHFLLAGCDQSLLRWGSLASSSATCIAPYSRPRASHLSQCGLPASGSGSPPAFLSVSAPAGQVPAAPAGH